MPASPLSDDPIAQVSNQLEEVGWFSGHLINIMPVGVCVCNMDGFVLTYNTRAAELWGYEPSLTGLERARYCGSKNIYLLDGTLLRRMEFPVVQVLADGQPKRDLQFSIEQPSGTRVVTVANINPILDAHKNQVGAVVCFQDISFKLRYEQQQLELTKSLLRGAKMATITHMAAEWAHDFNNLLHGVRCGLDLIRRQLVRTSNSRGCEHIDLALQEIAKATPLVQRLLVLARGSVSDQTLCSIDSIVVSLSDLMQHVLGPAISLTLDLKTPDAAVRMNRSVFEDILMNLCVNAHHAMPTGGEVVISSRMHLAQVETPSDSIGPRLAFSIRDNGHGMSQEDLQLALDPSSIVKQDYESPILRFAMAKRFVTLSGGILDLRSQSGVGTNVTMLLPVENGLASQQHADRVATVVSKQPCAGISPSLCRRILLVEDDDNIQHGLTVMLQMAGHEVIASSSGENAVELLRSEPPFDLVISDHALPGTLQDADVLDIVVGRYPSSKAILITGLPPHHISRTSYQMLIKPFSFEELEEAMVMTQ